ncbi:hypothetical protein [Borrelia sp. P9F1]|uniref:hypothetical protein n=1 Tax=Borrelia sp. P9F1 TaxID=3058374 RepID=UPI002647473F|nr:hypothetical protein [Borrelia sp. P9F1]WKC58477.1 hypothetical protein QYZ68_04475 [Borrelia sp. P9F1]
MIRNIIEKTIDGINDIIDAICDCVYHLYCTISGKELRELKDRFDFLAGELRAHRLYLDVIAERREEHKVNANKCTCGHNAQPYEELDALIREQSKCINSHKKSIDVKLNSWNDYEKNIRMMGNLKRKINRLNTRVARMRSRRKVIK